MQTANILLAIGGNKGTTVPKFGITAAEIAVLRHIHGEDSVTDVEPVGTVQRTHRDERRRLTELYGRSIEGKFRAPAVDELFPGAAARVFENLNELDLPEEFFKAATRVSAAPAPRTQPEPIAVASEADGGEPAAVTASEAESVEEPTDGVEDMKDEHSANVLD